MWTQSCPSSTKQFAISEYTWPERAQSSSAWYFSVVSFA
ncbi:hypothetical protein SAMN06295924_104317 [Rathayibacter rathayi NCPPB 2980 = VKM Ac-1601]|nr:hypothetical protein FB469_2557 [Rathayibacter rathayi]SOE04637.1 hypothetical protein SAMN06295924_104317 [Rathayibacter rathayi NCPPB 2980 = VKM Ac-1601]